MINRIILPQTRPWAGSPVWIGDFQQDGREQIQVFIRVKGCGLKLVWLCWCTVYTWCILRRAAVNRCLRTSWWIPFSLLGHEGSLAPVFLSTVQIILLSLSVSRTRQIGCAENWLNRVELMSVAFYEIFFMMSVDDNHQLQYQINLYL